MYRMQNLLLRLARQTSADWLSGWLLALGAFVTSAGMTLWDIGAVGLLIERAGLFAIGMDFLIVAAVLSVIGRWTWTLERRKGYGALVWIGLSAGVSALLLGGLAAGETGPLIVNAVFVSKYLISLVVFLSFWSVAGRFIPFRMDSIKFIGLFCIALFGLFAGGTLPESGNLSAVGTLVAGCFLFFAAWGIVRWLTVLEPVPAETFTKKSGGVQDSIEKKVVACILALSFVYMMSKGLMDYFLYQFLSGQEGERAGLLMFARLWRMIGLVGLIMVAALYRTRYIYTTMAGMSVICVGMLMTAYGAAMAHAIILSTGYVIFTLGAYFYLSGYFRLLAKPLSFGRGPRIKYMRFVWAEPIGLMLAGVLLIHMTDKAALLSVLGGCAVVLIALVVYSGYLYADVLLTIFKIRSWRGGPLLISYPSLSQYIQSHLASDNVGDVIYFLRVLEAANHPDYPKWLLRSLKHESPEVRVFALKRLGALPRVFEFSRMIENIFHKDKSDDVLCQALSLLIKISAGNNPVYAGEAFLSYLGDKKLRRGAMIGFLKVGGDRALQVMPILQRLAVSRREEDQLAALDVMSAVPNAAYMPLLTALLKSHRPNVVCQALTCSGRSKHPQLLPFVFQALDDVDLQECALNALRLYGKIAFPSLEKIIASPDVSLARRKCLIAFLGALDSGEGKQILLRSLTIDNQKLRKFIIQNVLDSGIVWIHSDKQDILRASLKRDIERIHWLIQFRSQYTWAPSTPSEEAFGFLTRAITEDIADTRELVLHQLLLLKTDKMFVKAIRVLLGSEYDKYLPAMSMIQDVLPSSLYQKLKTVLILPLEQKQHMPVQVMAAEDIAHELSQVLTAPPFTFNHWIRASILYCLRQMGHPDALAAVKSQLKETHPVVLEAAILAFVKLEKRKKEVHRVLLALPTTALVGQSLDELLEY